MYGNEVQVPTAKVTTIKEYIYGPFRTHSTKNTLIDSADVTVSEDVSVVKKMLKEANKNK